MGYLFLTGATGLLGSYLVRDLLRAGVELAVLVRSTRFESARQRVDGIVTRWERHAENFLGFVRLGCLCILLRHI